MRNANFTTSTATILPDFQGAICPQCSTREDEEPQPLSVLVAADNSAKWYCAACHWEGGDSWQLNPTAAPQKKQAPPTALQHFLTLEQVCERLQVHRVTVMRWVAAGKFPAPLKPSGRLLFGEDDIQAWQRKEREKAKQATEAE